MKNVRKFVCLLLVMAMSIACLPAGVLAADEVASGTCGDDLTWTLDSEGTLTISGTGEMENLIYGDDNYSEAYWQDYASSIYKVVIEDGVASISDSAFSRCSNMIEIAIPNSVTSIGKAAFQSCCSLTSITIPDTVSSICAYTFHNCESLTNFTIPDSVTSIGENAFSYCSSLTSITIPESVTSIGLCAFQACTSLSGIWVAEGNAYYSNNESGVLFNEDQTELIQAPGGLTGNYTIQDGVINIGSCAFAGCSGLTDITIPNSVTGIGDSAFSGCLSLTSITISDSVTSIDGWAFCVCSSLTAITIPGCVTSIGGYTFFCCFNLNSITFLGDAPEIGECGFWGMTATAYYPAGNETWTEDVLQDYGGTLTWVAWYEVLEGEDCRVTQGQDAAMRVDCNIEEFISVSVDGETVDPANYTVTEGSTIVTFHADWLKTLAEGAHSVELQFTDGVANATLTVVQNILLGDVNGDGEIDIFDANAAAAYANELRDLDDTQLLAGDVNGDGEVDIFDANLIAAYANELLAKFPAEP